MPRSTSSSRTFLCRTVDPIWSITSSPASGIFLFRYLDCHALFEAIRAGVALMKALLDCRAAWAYIWLAFDAPVGVKFTNTSAFDSVSVLAVLLGLESLTSIFSPAIGDTPAIATRISRAIDLDSIVGRM